MSEDFPPEVQQIVDETTEGFRAQLAEIMRLTNKYGHLTYQQQCEILADLRGWMRRAEKAEADLAAIRTAMQPVWHWYQSDEHHERNLSEIMLDMVADVQSDRAEALRLKTALGTICQDSNPDWTEKRLYPFDVLDDIHKIAVGAYYDRTTRREQADG